MPRYANPPAVIHKPTVKPVDPAQHSAAYKLFHNRYAATTAQMNLYSKAYLEISGTVTSGNKECDAAMAHAQVRVWLTPAGMAQFLDDGQSFFLITREDSVPIYELINEHLTDWRRLVQREINPAEVPWDDLRKFEILASELFPVAQGFMSRKISPLQAMFNRGGGLMRGLSRDAPKAPEEAKNPSVAGQTPVPQMHTPILDAMRKEMQEPVASSTKKATKPWQ